MEISATSYCPDCGAELRGDSLFCSRCGSPLVGGDPSSSAPVPYLISPARIVFMSVLSFGLYLAYWLYKTWQHYRNHTGAEAYPIWHGLTLFVPIYGSFRTHAHLRTFGELSDRVRLYLGFSPELAFAIVFVGLILSSVLPGFVLTVIAGALSGNEVVPVIDPFTGRQAIDPATGAGLTKSVSPTGSAFIWHLLLRMVSIGAEIWMMLHAQLRINYYWSHVYGSRLVDMGGGKGEAIVGIFGALVWILTIINVLFG